MKVGNYSCFLQHSAFTISDYSRDCTEIPLVWWTFQNQSVVLVSLGHQQPFLRYICIHVEPPCQPLLQEQSDLFRYMHCEPTGSLTSGKFNWSLNVTENRNSIPTTAHCSHQGVTNPNWFLGGRAQTDVICFTCRSGDNTLFPGTPDKMLDYHKFICNCWFRISRIIIEVRITKSIHFKLISPRKTIPRSRALFIYLGTCLAALQRDSAGDSQSRPGFPTANCKSDSSPNFQLHQTFYCFSGRELGLFKAVNVVINKLTFQ